MSRHHQAKINNRRWTRVRLEVLHRDSFRCRRAGPRLEIDHVVPLDQGGAVYDVNNLQTLCGGAGGCHAVKTAAENRRESEEVAAQTCKAGPARFRSSWPVVYRSTRPWRRPACSQRNDETAPAPHLPLWAPDRDAVSFSLRDVHPNCATCAAENRWRSTGLINLSVVRFQQEAQYFQLFKNAFDR